MNLTDLQRNWDRMGAQDPLWAVATADQYRGNRWEVDDFFATGRAQVADTVDFAKKVLNVPGFGGAAALDFGCGVGRLTQALAEHFDSVIGIDIAPAMIRHAVAFNRYGERVTYVLNTQSDLACLGSDRFDLVFSEITLMHMEPRYAKAYMTEFVRVAKPGCLIVFQTCRPTIKQRIRGTLPRPLVYGINRLRTRKHPMMEIYGMKPEEVVRHMEEKGAIRLALKTTKVNVGHRHWIHDRHWFQR